MEKIFKFLRRVLTKSYWVIKIIPSRDAIYLIFYFGIIILKKDGTWDISFDD
jgi:hypothetical protein